MSLLNSTFRILKFWHKATMHEKIVFLANVSTAHRRRSAPNGKEVSFWTETCPLGCSRQFRWNLDQKKYYRLFFKWKFITSKLRVVKFPMRNWKWHHSLELKDFLQGRFRFILKIFRLFFLSEFQSWLWIITYKFVAFYIHKQFSQAWRVWHSHKW